MPHNPIIWRRALALCAVTTLIVACWLVSPSLAQAPPGPDGSTNPAPAVQPAAPTGPTAPAGPVSPAAEKPEEPPTPAEIDIDVAIKKLAKLKSVTAELIEQVNVLNQKFTVKGSYRKGPNNLSYTQLSVSGLVDSAATSLQVCDGETLWDHQMVLDSPIYRKMSIKPVLERLNSPELDPKVREQFFAQMGLSGPETLLLGLRKSLKFNLKDEGELNGMKVWMFRGTWRSRQGLVGLDARPFANSGLLPPYMPMDATLYLGKNDSWPYKLVLVGRKPSVLFETWRVGPDGRPVGERLHRKGRPQRNHSDLQRREAGRQAASGRICLSCACVGHHR